MFFTSIFSGVIIFVIRLLKCAHLMMQYIPLICYIPVDKNICSKEFALDLEQLMLDCFFFSHTEQSSIKFY